MLPNYCLFYALKESSPVEKRHALNKEGGQRICGKLTGLSVSVCQFAVRTVDSPYDLSASVYHAKLLFGQLDYSFEED